MYLLLGSSSNKPDYLDITHEIMFFILIQTLCEKGGASPANRGRHKIVIANINKITVTMMLFYLTSLIPSYQDRPTQAYLISCITQGKCTHPLLHRSIKIIFSLLECRGNAGKFIEASLDWKFDGIWSQVLPTKDEVCCLVGELFQLLSTNPTFRVCGKSSGSDLMMIIVA